MAEKKVSLFNTLNGIGLEEAQVPFEIKGGSRSDKKTVISAINELAEKYPDGGTILSMAQLTGYSIRLHKDMKENGYVDPADKTINLSMAQGIYELEMAIMEHGANAAAIGKGGLLNKYTESLITPPRENWAMSLKPFGAMVAEGKAYAAIAMDRINNEAASKTLYHADPHLFGLMQEYREYFDFSHKELLEAVISYHMNKKEIKEQAYYDEAYKHNKTAVRMIQAGAEFKVNPEKAKKEIAPKSKAPEKKRLHADINEANQEAPKNEVRQEASKNAAAPKKELNPAILAAITGKKSR